VPELRRDPVVGRWVIVSTERARRPADFAHGPATAPGGDCPFCEHREAATPGEIYALRPGGGAPDTPGWQVRVIPSTHPLLDIEGSPDRAAHGMFDMMNDVGAHEVILESPRHVENMADLDVDQVDRVLDVYLHRVRALEAEEGVKSVLLFKNHGVRAGAGTITHAHSQLIATPVAPKQIQRELDGAHRHFDYKERCIFCDILQQESEDRTHIVAETEHFVSLCPYCSRFPYETWILPRRHACDFGAVTGPERADLAAILQATLAALKRALDDPPYNYVLHTAPFRRRNEITAWDAVREGFHWHIEVMPRLTQVAGFEWGSGFYINPVPPEHAAADLRGGSR
jgi:UDPglucose--hexose-1-phosphate uridylyltransferase